MGTGDTPITDLTVSVHLEVSPDGLFLPLQSIVPLLALVGHAFVL